MDDDSGTIHEDVLNGVTDEGEAALLARFATKEPAEEPENTEAREETVETSEAPAEGTETPEEVPEPTIAGDDAVVTVKEGDTEHKVKVADLKRLFGQEASLTRKSQELSANQERATAEGQKALAVMETLTKRAQEDWAQYAGVDLALAAQRLDERAYKQLRGDMEASYRHLMFLTQESDGIVSQVRQHRSEQHQEALKAVDGLMAKDVPDWTASSRSEVVAYAKAQGMNAGVADGLADPAALKMIRKAMLFDKGTKAVEAKVTPKAASSPTKPLKPGQGQAQDTPDKQRDALARLRKTGSVDDAAALFRARFGARD